MAQASPAIEHLGKCGGGGLLVGEGYSISN